jgi:thiamine-phosphate pyrophosphorylase
MAHHDPRSERRARLDAARLYLVCGAAPDTLQGAPPLGAHPEGRRQAGGRELPTLLRAAIAGGVEIVQLREKHMRNEELVSEATAARALCAELDTLLIVNDRPWVAREAGADGIHVGQEDIPPAEVRELVGPEMLVGLSTHSPTQIDAVDASVVDYIGVGPIHATPTKPGRPAVGLDLIRYAAAHSPVPFFAIGGLDADNVADAFDAGATRVCVLRAIANADDPEQAARALRERLTQRAGGA